MTIKKRREVDLRLRPVERNCPEWFDSGQNRHYL